MQIILFGIEIYISWFFNFIEGSNRLPKVFTCKMLDVARSFENYPIIHAKVLLANRFLEINIELLAEIA